MHFSDATYSRFVRLISNATGIQLGENRRQMLRNRITGRMRQLKLMNYEDYLNLIEHGGAQDELRKLIDSVTTNYTGFFRDPAQFEHAGQVIEQLFHRGQQKVRIWSAACSTGEEVYSLAITASLAAKRCKVDIDRIRILATDISQKVLCYAFRGIYPEDKIRSLSEQYQRFFQTVDSRDDDYPGAMLRIDQELRGITIFRRINLCEHPLSIPNGIDIIFLRNVLLYFEPGMIQNILSACTSKLATGGHLYVGASESVGDYLPYMQVARPCVYQLVQKNVPYIGNVGQTSQNIMECSNV